MMDENKEKLTQQEEVKDDTVTQPTYVEVTKEEEETTNKYNPWVWVLAIVILLAVVAGLYYTHEDNDTTVKAPTDETTEDFVLPTDEMSIEERLNSDFMVDADGEFILDDEGNPIKKTVITVTDTIDTTPEQPIETNILTLNKKTFTQHGQEYEIQSVEIKVVEDGKGEILITDNEGKVHTFNYNPDDSTLTREHYNYQLDGERELKEYKGKRMPEEWVGQWMDGEDELTVIYGE